MADIDKFLSTIALTESSGGKNTDHPRIKSGMHKGTHAIGTYALMPLTIDEFAGRSSDPEVKALKSLSPEEKYKAILPGSEIEQKLAREMAEYVLTKQNGDENKAAYSWLYGHNKTPNQIEKTNYLDDEYVQRFGRNAARVEAKSGGTERTAAKASNPVSVDGTPDADKIASYLGANPTVAHNMAQKAELVKALAGSGGGAFTPVSSGMSGIGSSPAKAALEDEPVAKPVMMSVAPVAAPDRFGSINDLIKSYRNVRK